jgi:hypothetical protein
MGISFVLSLVAGKYASDRPRMHTLAAPQPSDTEM